MENHNFENQGTFNREMNSRHLQMLSIGGVIGTGLFLSSGYTIAQAGPFGAVAAYLFGAIMVYLVMFSLGELSVAMPVTGSFHTYATKFISPGTGFMVAWMYWLCWVVALASQFVGAALLPMSEAGVTETPFVLVLDKIGFPYAADIMNFIILTAILSASTSGLYASSRMLWSLANEGMISKELVKINKHGVPMRGMILSMIGVVIALIASIYAEDTIFLALVSIAGFAVVIAWLAIPLAQIGFRREFLKTHSEDELEYKTPFSPILPWITVILLVISIIGIGWDPSQRAGLYFGVPFMIGCYIYHYIRFKKW
ncbi:amino acid permease [Streptococcus suis]|nr:amino acid permease [Streptococcus suis]